MLTIKEINDLAGKAINEAYEHYFTDLTFGQTKLDELNFIVLLFQETPPWLLFTEEALEAIINDKVSKSSVHSALLQNLVMLFMNYFAVEETDYNRYVGHLARSYHTSAGDKDKTMMPEAHYDRLLNETSIRVIMDNNRMLVMLATSFAHLRTGILTGILAHALKNI